MRRSSSIVAALAPLAFPAGACGALGGDGPSGGPRSADRPAAALGPEDEPPAGAESEFTTDFSKHSVSYSEILSGGPTKDGIPAIDDPRFVGAEAADAWLEQREPVILFRVGDDVRAYPIQIVLWHEIVNDTVGGVPVVVTFCPLCNTAIAFERTVDERELTFGTTGRLRFSNLIMYDRQTESWWQQATGEAVAYPYDILQQARAVNDTVGGKPVVVLWAPGTATALDEGAVAAGRDVGSAAVFSRTTDGRTLTFRSEGARIVDEQTGSEWNLLGDALEDELTDQQLERVVSIDNFWFSWVAFRPDTQVYKPQSTR